MQATLAETRDGRLRLWAHGDHPGAAALAESMGFRQSRALWQMRRSLHAPLPAVTLPEGVTVRTFEPGPDDADWVALNAAAFRDHPEQGTWTVEDLHRRMREPWFDRDGFFLAHRDDRLVGFHWTKVHGGDGPHTDGPHAHEGHGHDPIGEVYVVGVDPAEHGTGLGKALTVDRPAAPAAPGPAQRDALRRRRQRAGDRALHEARVHPVGDRPDVQP